MAKSKLTPETQSRICELIEDGNYARVAAEAAGISESTFYSWLEQGKEARSGKYREFLESVTRAEAASEQKLLAIWRSAAPQDWRAARDLLARRFPERWASREHHEHSGPGGDPLKVVVTWGESDANA